MRAHRETPAPGSRPVVREVVTPPIIDVAVAVLWRVIGQRYCVLLTRRPAYVHLAGSWELPGGKVREGETAADAVVREVREETGLEVSDPTLLTRTRYHYDDRSVRLLAYLLTAPAEGRPRSQYIVEHRWVDVRDLTDYDLPPANEPITKAILARFRVDASPERGGA